MAHHIAARGYDREAGTCARSRPTYPAAAVADLCTQLGLTAGGRVAELGAGTGIFTRLLVERGRLLKPGGGLGLIFSRYDRSVPWVAQLADISNRRRPPDVPGESSGAWRTYSDWTHPA